MRRILVPTLLAAFVVVATAAGKAVDPQAIQADCTRTAVGLVPLPDLRTGRHHGYEGGLYPNGENTPPSAYVAQGIAARDLVRPINGRIVLLSIGMSNTKQEYSRFKQYADRDSLKNPALTIVNGAQGGQDAERIRNPASPYWQFVDQRISAAGATPAQVQAVWLKQAIAGENRLFPADALRLKDDLLAIVDILRARFPNLQLVYLSSRIYAGYATTNLNPEPHAYQSSFAVKWTIQNRIDSSPTRPWLGWGPYLWTDGLRGRADGLVWRCSDVQPDGTHPSPTGVHKVAKLLLLFFKGDVTTRPWFLQRNGLNAFTAR
jgi:hypothetical protein